MNTRTRAENIARLKGRTPPRPPAHLLPIQGTQLPLELPLGEPLPALPCPCGPAIHTRAWAYVETFDRVTPEGDETHGFGTDGDDDYDLETELAEHPHGSPAWRAAYEEAREAARTRYTPDPLDRADTLEELADALDARRRAWWNSPAGTAGPYPEPPPEPSLEELDSAGAVRWVVEALTRKGCTEANGRGCWYSADDDVDHRTGASTRYAVHLEGFTPAELAQVSAAVRA